MADYLPPIVVEIIGRDKDLLDTLARDKAALRDFATTTTEANLGADDKGVVTAVEKAQAVLEKYANQTWFAGITVDTHNAEVAAKLASMDATIKSAIADADEMLAAFSHETWYAGIGVEVHEAQVQAALASLDATIASYKAYASVTAEPSLGSLYRGEGDGGGGGGLFSALGFGSSKIPFLGGLAGFGTIASLLGFDALHGITSGIGIGGSMLGAGLGAGFLGLGAAGTGAVGMGTDMAGMGQAISDVQKYRTALNQLKTAQATYGQSSVQAAQATAHLNAVLAAMPKTAQPAIVALSTSITGFIAAFDKATGLAEKIGAQILTQAVKVGMTFLPTIGKYAAQNMGIIKKDLQPFFQWLDTGTKSFGGLSIFKNLEAVFQKNLPTAIHAAEQGFELLAKTITISSSYLGHFVHWINDFLTRMNGATFQKFARFAMDMIGLFEKWFPLLVTLGKTILDVFQPAVGLGGQFAVLLTTILKQIDTWLTSANMKTVLHDLFSVHLIEVITGIGGVVKASLPFIEGFATAFLRVVTVGARLANMVLLPLASVLRGIAGIPFATQVLGWAAAGLVVVAAFNRLRTFLSTLAVKIMDFNVGTWLSNLGTSAEEATAQMKKMAVAVQTGVTASLRDLGMTAESTGASLEGMGAAAATAGEEGAAAAGESGLGALGGLSGILGPAGLIAGGIAMVAGLASSFLHLGQSVTLKKVSQAVQQLNQQLGAMPTSGLAAMNTYLVNITKALAQVVTQFKHLTPGSQGAADAAAKVGDLTTKSINAARAAATFRGNVTALAKTFGLTKQQVTQFASAAGINLTKALTTRLVHSFEMALKATLPQGYTTAKLKEKGFAAQVVQDAKAMTDVAKKTYPQLAHGAAEAMALEDAVFKKTGLKVIVDLANSQKGGLPAVTHVAKEYGIHIPSKYMSLLHDAMTKGGRISIQKLATAMASQHRVVKEEGNKVITVITEGLVRRLKRTLMPKGGKDSMHAFATAIASGKTHISQVTAANALAAATAIVANKGAFRMNGTLLMQELAQGIRGARTDVVQAVQTVVNAAFGNGAFGSSHSLQTVVTRIKAGTVNR